MIEINNLTKTYPGSIQALRGIDLSIGSGMFGLVGPNGAGKTTLMRIISCIIRPTNGHVEVFGHSVATKAGKQAIKTGLGYLPQELGMYPDLTAQEFLDYFAILKGVTDKRQRRLQVAELLELVRLSEAAGRKIKGFSGGMKRRVGIAQALLGNPKLLIVDEPTAGLDPEERVRLRNLLADAAARCTVILSTHIIEDISQSCRDLAVINQGQVAFQGSPRNLIKQVQGQVWLVTTDGQKPNGRTTVVSSMHLQEGVQYRVLGDASEYPNARTAEPSLEDGYIWLMQGIGDNKKNSV
jgi:ABC-type multidrug transport system ATPase subunit